MYNIGGPLQCIILGTSTMYNIGGPLQCIILGTSTLCNIPLVFGATVSEMRLCNIPC